MIAPFRAVPSLGTNVAKQIVEARKDGPFLSKEDLATRGKVSKTLIEYMNDNGVLKDFPDENQLSLIRYVIEASAILLVILEKLWYSYL